MTGWDLLEISLGLLVGGRCLFEGIYYKKTARKHLRVLRDEYRYGRGRVRAFYVLLGLLPILLGVMLVTVVSMQTP